MKGVIPPDKCRDFYELMYADGYMWEFECDLCGKRFIWEDEEYLSTGIMFCPRCRKRITYDTRKFWHRILLKWMDSHVKWRDTHKPR